MWFVFQPNPIYKDYYITPNKSVVCCNESRIKTSDFQCLHYTMGLYMLCNVRMDPKSIGVNHLKFGRMESYIAYIFNFHELQA